MAGAVETSFSDSVVARLDPVAISPAGAFLVPLEPLLVGADLLDVAGAVAAQLGDGYGVDGSRSRWEQVRSYTKNVELRLNMVLAGSELFASPYAPDGRSVSVGVQYSFRALPEKGYSARAADDRVGYFLTVHKDFSRTDIEGPWVRSVNRWRLEKADPKAPRSPVKKPIVFYLGRNVPYRWRPYLRDGILEWNKAFEEAGLLDAVEVRYQTDEDEWEAEDVRYNTIRWVLGDVPFGAVGPSRVDPRTGEILDADILFSGEVPRSFWRAAALAGVREDEGQSTPERVLAAAAWLHGEAHPQEAPHLDAPTHHAPWSCRVVEELAQSMSVAAAAGVGADQSVSSSVATTGTTEAAEVEEDPEGPPPLPEAFVGAALKWIVMHEVGHTLGLRHNFRASTVRTRAQVQNAAFTREHGMAGSVMDYLPVNMAEGEESQGEYFMSTVGPYDLWAIQYGYQPVKKDEELVAIAARAAEPELAYSTDEDVANLFYRKLDPRVHVNDLSDDPLESPRASATPWPAGSSPASSAACAEPGRSPRYTSRAPTSTATTRATRGGSPPSCRYPRRSSARPWSSCSTVSSPTRPTSSRRRCSTASRRTTGGTGGIRSSGAGSTTRSTRWSTEGSSRCWSSWWRPRSSSGCWTTSDARRRTPTCSRPRSSWRPSRRASSVSWTPPRRRGRPTSPASGAACSAPSWPSWRP
jgi:hypothetical protein